MNSAVRLMLDLVEEVVANSAEANIYVGNHVFRVASVHVSVGGGVVKFRRKGDDAEIMILATAITAVEEIASSYP